MISIFCSDHFFLVKSRIFHQNRDQKNRFRARIIHVHVGGALTLLRPDFVCTTRCFMMIMDQKKCFRYFFWPPAEKILKYWIRNPCYNAKNFKLETSISDPKIAQTHIPDLEFHKKINRKWHRSDGNLLLVLDSSLGQKLEMRNFWCSKPWWKLVFWSETKLENRVSEGVRQKIGTFRKIYAWTSFSQVFKQIASLSSKEF